MSRRASLTRRLTSVRSRLSSILRKKDRPSSPASQSSAESINESEVSATTAPTEVHDEPREAEQTNDKTSSQVNGEVSDEADGEQRAVQLPDLFSSIMSVECAICPHYTTVREKSEAYINKAYNFSDKQKMKNHLVNFAFMASAWAPLADEETLLTLTDWLHWTFYFDDQFDEGHLNDDPIKADVEIKATLALFDENAPYVSAEENGIQHVFQDTWRRFKLRSSKELQARFIKSIVDYCDGVLNQVKVHQAGTIIAVDQYMAFRRASIGTYPSFALIEYCHGIDLPQRVIDHKSISICEIVASDITILHNDILSYKKDIAQDVEHNIIILLQRQGMNEQDAIDHVNGMLQECFRQWYTALIDLPSWGERIDRDVLRYLDACRNVALGNLYWSFESGRYFGKDGPRVRETRVMMLP